MNMWMRFLLETLISSLLDKCSHYISIFHLLLNFHTVFYSSHIILQSHQKCTSVPVFQILANTSFVNSHTIISLWFWFAFPCGLEMLNTFSYTCWLFVHLLGGMSIHIRCLFFNHVLFLCHWVVGVPCMFWMLTPYQINGFQIFYPIL